MFIVHHRRGYKENKRPRIAIIGGNKTKSS